MQAAEFRKELTGIMPGYKWTIHKSSDPKIYLCAEGIQTSGFNRLSTLQVVRRERDGKARYEVKSSGYGKRAPWLATAEDGTLARALRALQNHHEHMAANYRIHASDLQIGRKHPAPANNQQDGGDMKCPRCDGTGYVTKHETHIFGPCSGWDTDQRDCKHGLISERNKITPVCCGSSGRPIGNPKLLTAPCLVEN